MIILDKVSVNDVCMNYHTISSSIQALREISFSVKEGEFLSIAGPSGCGKSTILNIISGLVSPSSGEVFVDGERVYSISGKLGYMFQRDHLFNWITVWDNIMLGIKIQRKPKKEYEQRVLELLTNYSLIDFKDNFPQELSGGMRQKVALIRTLALDPEVLLLDEPFSALDYQTRLNISDEIYNIIKGEKKTVIMVTHDISEAISMSDRVIVLSKRPAEISGVFEIKFNEEKRSPILCRENPEFRIYFNNIWRKLNS